MNVKSAVAVALALGFLFPLGASAKKKKVQPRGMLESMQSVPCGAKQRGLAGVGSIWASVGVTHVNSTEKLCQQYLVRTDDMDYEIRPKDTKHPEVLPIGQEVTFKINHDHMDIQVGDGGKKMTYIVVSMQPANAGGATPASGAMRSTDVPSGSASASAQQPTGQKPPEQQ
jgi:hypothetical protein